MPATETHFRRARQQRGPIQPLPNNGYDYQGLEIRVNSWGWVSKGLNYNGDFTADERPIADPIKGQQTNVITYSGNNALMNNADGYGRLIDASNYAGGHRYYDPKILWIAPENQGAFQFKMACEGYRLVDNREKVWNVPALVAGQMYQVKIPSDWQHMWRCRMGAVGLQ
ncbi:MAG: hypothetical protein Q9226_005047 [Calogaya cf. arnoldii]